MQEDIYEKLLNLLKESDLIEYFDVNAQTIPLVIKLAENPSEIFIEDNNLY